jgi:hypothetical protein
MAYDNVDAPFGFRFYSEAGKDYPNLVPRPVAASRTDPIAVGDPYTIGTDGFAIKAVAGAVHGIVAGFDFAPKTAGQPESQDYLPAADAGTILGIEDPNVHFEAQITTVALADFDGSACDIVGTDADATTRQSREELDGATIGSGAQFRLVRLVPRPVDNALGANAKVIVRMLQAFGG